MTCRVTPRMDVKPLRGHLHSNGDHHESVKKAGTDGGVLGPNTTRAAAMRARAKGSWFTNCMVGESPATGVGAGVGPEKSENGDCEMAGAMCLQASAGCREAR